MAGGITEGIEPAGPKVAANAPPVETTPPFREWLRDGHVEAWVLLDFIVRESARPAPCPTRLDWAKRRFSAIMEDVVACGDGTAINDLLRLIDASLATDALHSPPLRRILRFLARERRWIIDHAAPSRDVGRSP